MFFLPVFEVYEVYHTQPLARLHISPGGTYILASEAAVDFPVLNAIQVHVRFTVYLGGFST
jgi:hypothetical protein